MPARVLVQDLERRLLPALRTAEARLRAQFPRVRVRVEHHPYGPPADRVGHNFYLSCLLDQPPPDEPDDVTLELCFPGAYGPAPRVSAEVVWGDPSGRVEGEVFPEGQVPLTEQTLGQVEAALPKLVNVLRGALMRGCPPPDAGGHDPAVA